MKIRLIIYYTIIHVIFFSSSSSLIYASKNYTKDIADNIKSYTKKISKKSTKEIIKKAMRSVVLIHTFSEGAQKNNDSHLIHNSEINPRDKELKYYHGITNGTIIDKSGYIVSTYNSLQNSSEIIVSIDSEFDDNTHDINTLLIDKNNYKARIIKNIPELNISILKIDPRNNDENFPYINIGNISDLENSDNKMVYKNCFALGKCLGEHFVTLNKTSNTSNKFDVIVSPIETVLYKKIEGIKYLELKNKVLGSCVYPENSAGPIIDEYGNMIGISDYQASSKTFFTEELAIPVNIIKKAINIAVPNLIPSNSGVDIGIFEVENIEGVSDNIKKGIRIISIKHDSIAENSGLKVDDIIVRFNKENVTNKNVFKNLLDQSIGENSFTLTIIRNNKIIEIEIYK